MGRAASASCSTRSAPAGFRPSLERDAQADPRPRAEQHFHRIAAVPRASRDAEAMTPDFLQMLVSSFREGLRSSAKGPIVGRAHLRRALALHSGRHPRPRAHLAWHGGHASAGFDRPPLRQIHPAALGHFPEDEGHVSIVVNYLESIVADLRRP